MNVYLVVRTDRVTYDEWDAIVVVAESEEDALSMGPAFCYNESRVSHFEGDWLPKPRKATLLATDARGPRRTVLSSFNAG